MFPSEVTLTSFIAGESKAHLFLFFYFFGKGVRNWQVVSFQIGNGFFRRIVVGKGLFVWFAGSAARACVCVCVRARERVYVLGGV